MRSATTPAEPPASWQEIAPHLDELVEKLPARYRTAIMLRFYEQKSLAEIATYAPAPPVALAELADHWYNQD
jgi:DNA-directed RNA polymerase specialized sigma24 family protein